jgi:hypothetical protein
MIIGVSGKKRTGKDTFYKIAKKLLEGKSKVKRYAFADAVKEYAIKYFNIPKEDIKLEENRYILQAIGQMLREEVSKEYWINKVLKDVHASRVKNPGEISIITDVRYTNEAEAILHSDNALLIRIEKDNVDTLDMHQSENDLDDFQFDVVIQNNGTVEQYEAKVTEWLKSNLPWIIHW